LKSIQRRGTAAYYTQRLRQARKDFVHTLSLEYSTLFEEYLNKVEASILKAKVENLQKLKKKVAFSSGIDFTGDKSAQKDEMHPDEFIRLGVQEFKRKSP